MYGGRLSSTGASVDVVPGAGEVATVSSTSVAAAERAGKAADVIGAVTVTGDERIAAVGVLAVVAVVCACIADAM